MLKVLAVAAALAATAVPLTAAESSPAEKRGCEKSYTYKAASRGLRLSLRHHHPMTRAMGARAWRYVLCVRTVQHRKWLQALRKKLRVWRRSYAHVWRIRFNGLPALDQQWAVDTSSCEAGMNPSTSTGNGFYGAFQFMQSTWTAAGGTGNPAQHSWHYQAVVAVRWMHQAGASQWPICGV